MNKTTGFKAFFLHTLNPNSNDGKPPSTMTYKLLFVLFFLFSLLTYSWISYYPTNKIPITFPKSLLTDQGSPIHPECVLRTQFGDRLDPQPIYQNFENEYRKNNCEILSTSLEADFSRNSIDWTINYISEFDTFGTNEHSHHVTYQAWPVDDNTNLVLVDHYTSDSTGRFTNLGLVKREGDFLINCGEIAGGDRVHVSVDFFENNILQYSCIATPSTILSTFLDKFSITASFDPSLASLARYCAGEFIWQCQIHNNHVTASQLIGIRFNDDLYIKPSQNGCSNSEFITHAKDQNTLLSFPKALLTTNGLIHPNCVVNTQFGDRSRWEPKYIFEDDKDFCEEENIQTHLHTDFNTTPLTYICDYYGEDTHYRAAYQAWPTSDSTSLVLTNHYWGGSGRFTNLGLVKREGDFLINCGEIAGGDRAYGSVSVDFFENNLLQYRCMGTPLGLMSILKDQLSVKVSPDCPLECSPKDCVGESVWRCRIDNETVTDSQLVGIIFND